jgi:hypothetical protein
VEKIQAWRIASFATNQRSAGEALPPVSGKLPSHSASWLNWSFFMLSKFEILLYL